MSLAALPPVITVICSNTEIVFETAMMVLVLCGVLFALWDPRTNTMGGELSDDSNTSSNAALLFAVAMSISSRFASSLNTILAEKFLGKGAKSKIGVMECTLVNSFIPWCILPFGLLATEEYKKWPSQLHNASYSVRTTAIYAIVENTSTLFFAGVDSAMKMLAGIMSFVFFPSIGAVSLMYYDKRLKSLELAASSTVEKYNL
eukprot:gene26770-33403_t